MCPPYSSRRNPSLRTLFSLHCELNSLDGLVPATQKNNFIKTKYDKQSIFHQLRLSEINISQGKEVPSQISSNEWSLKEGKQEKIGKIIKPNGNGGAKSGCDV